MPTATVPAQPAPPSLPQPSCCQLPQGPVQTWCMLSCCSHRLLQFMGLSFLLLTHQPHFLCRHHVMKPWSCSSLVVLATARKPIESTLSINIAATLFCRRHFHNERKYPIHIMMNSLKCTLKMERLCQLR